ncbi:MAG: VCBS repeat-containing protein [Anaerolineae bacterium]|nr:VCBS repeat-containing protein [Anaerolineae bacterium]
MIDPQTPGTKNDVCLVGDLDGSGYNDVLVVGKYGENNLVWYRNPGRAGRPWERHCVGTAHTEAGGVLVDVNGSGRLDLVVGEPMDAPPGYTNTRLYWFECPVDPTERWKPHVIADRFHKYHDQAVGDVDGDGAIEIVFASQGAQVVGYYDIPADLSCSPWPEACLHIVAQATHVEGLAVADLDGDGQNEILAGPNVFKRQADGAWSRHRLPVDLDPRTCVAVGDLTGDGNLDIVLSEGELDSARVVWLRGPNWTPTLLGKGFYHAHSLDLADFDGNGRLDILVGEMGLGGYATPRQVVFRNVGGGRFEMEVVGHYATHAARAGDLTGNGRPDIVGKPYDAGRDQVDLLINRS